MKDPYEGMARYNHKCLECGCDEAVLMNASHPIIYKCVKCEYSWNPDNLPKVLVKLCPTKRS